VSENRGVALVTGATRGIGREVARQLADRDYSVIVSARDLGKAEAFASEIGGGAIALELDVSDPASIEAAVAAVGADPGRLDVLVNNAGVGLDWGTSATEPDRLSKAGLNAVTRMLSTELADAGFLVNSACPGFVKTDMGTPLGAWKSIEDGAAGIVWLATLPDDGPTGGFFRDGEPVVF
jgi:NAD(P)-dependent dehydrogenase (short-subunit alcohol dehydrogenase family)